MAIKKIIEKMAFLGLMSLLMSDLTACAPIVFGAAAGGGVVASQERTVGEAVDDNNIWATIQKEFISEGMHSLFTKIKVRVNEGRVLLVGTVDTDEHLLKSVEIVWSIRGVKEVMNELVVEDTQNKLHLGEYTKDTWITTQVKSKLLMHRDVKSVNYSVITQKGIVYLFGIARTEEEMELVNSLAAKVSSVEKVVSYIRVKDSEARKKSLKTYKD
jgi:osmotically-inducible protein OsmY